MWHDPREHLVERVSRDRGLPVAGEEASPLTDDPPGRWPASRGSGFGQCLGRIKPIEAVPFTTVFSRCDSYSIDDLPEHWVVRAQPVRLPIPPLFRHLMRKGGIEEEREDMVFTSPPIPCAVGRPDDHEQVRMFALNTREVVGTVQPQQVLHG